MKLLPLVLSTLAGGRRRSTCSPNALRAPAPAMMAAPPLIQVHAARAAAPSSSKAMWEVHKFGGASLATADLYKECSDLLISESKRSIDRPRHVHAHHGHRLRQGHK